MRTLRLLVLFIALLGLFACNSGGTVLPPDGGGNGDHATVISAMLARHNATRAGLGLGALTTNALLNQIAQNHANYMASTGIFSHVNGSGQNVDDRATAIGYHWNAIGENIGYFANPQELYDAWLGSPDHYENISSPAYNEIGIGVADAGNSQYWCVDFGHR